VPTKRQRHRQHGLVHPPQPRLRAPRSEVPGRPRCLAMPSTTRRSHYALSRGQSAPLPAANSSTSPAGAEPIRSRGPNLGTRSAKAPATKSHKTGRQLFDPRESNRTPTMSKSKATRSPNRPAKPSPARNVAGSSSALWLLV
jgi:hypothetical protein